MFRLSVVCLTPWLVAMGGGDLWSVRPITPGDAMPSTFLVDAESRFASRSLTPLPMRPCAHQRNCDEGALQSAPEIQVQLIRFKEGGDPIRTCSSESAQPGERINACTALLLSSVTDPGQRAHLYAQRGLAYYRAGAHDMAIADFTIALELDPTQLLALNGRCWIRAIAGVELGTARRDCDAAIAIDPEFHEALDSRAMLSMREGRWKDAWEDFNAAVSLRSDVAVYLYGRGLASLALRNKEEGNADLSRARTLDRRIDHLYRGFGLDSAEPPFAQEEDREHAQAN